MFLVAVSRNGIFLGTILFKGIAGYHPDEAISSDCEPPVFSTDTLQRISSHRKHGEGKEPCSASSGTCETSNPCYW